MDELFEDVFNIKGTVEKCSINSKWNANLVVLSLKDAFISGWSEQALQEGWEYLLKNVKLKYGTKKYYTTLKTFQTVYNTQYDKIKENTNLILNHTDMITKIAGNIADDERTMKFEDEYFNRYTKWKNSTATLPDLTKEEEMYVICRDCKRYNEYNITVNGRIIPITAKEFNALNNSKITTTFTEIYSVIPISYFSFDIFGGYIVLYIFCFCKKHFANQQCFRFEQQKTKILEYLRKNY